MINWNEFASTFGVIFLAEIPDKTAFAIVILATRENPLATFIGVCAAFLIQNIVAVCFGGFIVGLLPPLLVKISAALLFFVFSVLMWRKKLEDDEELSSTKRKTKSFLTSLWTSFLVIFIAEWGDLTQLATAALEAEFRHPLTIFIASTAALWSMTAIAVLLGKQLTQFINPQRFQKMASLALAAVGLVLLLSLIPSELRNF